MDADLQAAIQRLKRSGINLAPISPQMGREDFMRSLGCLYKEWLIHNGLRWIPLQITGESKITYNNERYFSHTAVRASIKAKFAELLQVTPRDPRLIFRGVHPPLVVRFDWPTNSLASEEYLEIALSTLSFERLQVMAGHESKSSTDCFGVVAFSGFDKPASSNDGAGGEWYIYNNINLQLFSFKLESDEEAKKKQQRKEVAAAKAKKKKEAEEKALLKELLQRYGDTA